MERCIGDTSPYACHVIGVSIESWQRLIAAYPDCRGDLYTSPLELGGLPTFTSHATTFAFVLSSNRLNSLRVFESPLVCVWYNNDAGVYPWIKHIA